MIYNHFTPLSLFILLLITHHLSFITNINPFRSSRFQGILRWFLNAYVSRWPSRRMRHWVYRQHFTLGPNANIMMGFQVRRLAGITLGRQTNVNPNCMFDSRGGDILIGDYVDIAPEVNIWTLEHDPQDPGFPTRGSGVTIEDYAWICNRAVILPGVRIGKGAVVATGAVVTKDVEPFTMVGGIPAKVIGRRNPDQQPRYLYRPWFL